MPTPTSLVAQTLKRLPTMQETWLQSLGQEDLLEKEMATHTSILAWKIPWMVEPGRLQSMGSQRVGQYWATLTHSLCRFLGSSLTFYFYFLALSFLSQPFLIGESSCMWILANCCSSELASFIWGHLLLLHHQGRVSLWFRIRWLGFFLHS